MTMKLSEAIREGAKLRPQAYGFFYNDGATCAQGAALEAVGMLDPRGGRSNHDTMREVWPWAAQVNGDIKCPINDDTCWPHHDGTAKDIIAHLNNDHRWTREAIADWVQSVEEALPQEVSQ